MINIVVTVRALVVHEDKLLMCKQSGSADFYCLPGGKLEPGETLEAGMERELLEETGVRPRVGHLLFINQFINDTNHRVEFFFLVTNAADYANFDPSKATHAHEVNEFVLGDPTDPKYNLKPEFLRDKFAEVLTRRHNFETQIIKS